MTVPVDVDQATLAALRDSDIAAFVERPAGWVSHVPLVILTPLSGRSASPTAHERCDYVAECWGRSRQEARDLARNVRQAVLLAWLTPSGPLNFARADTTPTPRPAGIDGLWRFDVAFTADAR